MDICLSMLCQMSSIGVHVCHLFDVCLSALNCNGMLADHIVGLVLCHE